MVYFKYIKLPLSISPKEIVQQYNLKYLVAADGYIYMNISKGILGLKQAGRIASNRLTKNLARNVFASVPHILSLRRQHT